LDSTPMVVFSGQVPTHLIGTDAFQECDTVGITRSCTKHNWLVKRIEDLPRIIHEAFYVATHGRPGPVVIDVPKDIQFATGAYTPPQQRDGDAPKNWRPRTAPDPARIAEAVALMARAKKPLFYTGGGVINAGPAASEALRALVHETGFPITSTLMGLGAVAADDPQWLGMVGMHGAWESNHAMHDCDLMINLGARFDDRVTGRIDAFSPGSKKIHVDIDPSSINKIVMVDLPIVADCTLAIQGLLEAWRARNEPKPDLSGWWKQIDEWRAKKGFSYKSSDTVIKPQHAIERLYEATKTSDVYITTEVGQHQMWAAQFFKFQEPNRWVTSGGLGTMGFGLPAAVGVQSAFPNATVIDIAGEASVQMSLQELSTAVQFNLPIKVFILNNEWMGMVRQWQELLHGGRYSHSYSDSLPDFVKLAEAYGCAGFRAETPGELDAKLAEFLAIRDRPAVFDCRVEKAENCYPMIPSGQPHNSMIVGEATDNPGISEEGKKLV
jgi:acetolactate synthase I/II/III large subunit